MDKRLPSLDAAPASACAHGCGCGHASAPAAPAAVAVPAHDHNHDHDHDHADHRGHDHDHDHDHERHARGHHDHGHGHDEGGGASCCGASAADACGTTACEAPPWAAGDGPVLRLRVPAMDCGAEEAEIRRALEPLAGIRALRFDLGRRQLSVQAPETLFPAVEAALKRLGMPGERLPELATGAAPGPERVWPRLAGVSRPPWRPRSWPPRRRRNCPGGWPAWRWRCWPSRWRAWAPTARAWLRCAACV